MNILIFLITFIFSLFHCTVFEFGVDSNSSIGSSSPPLSDDGNVSSSDCSEHQKNFILKHNQKLQINKHNFQEFIKRGGRTKSTSTSDEGIVMDYGDEISRKRKVSSYL